MHVLESLRPAPVFNADGIGIVAVRRWQLVCHYSL